MDGSTGSSDGERRELDARTVRLHDAIRRLERFGGPVAERALDEAAAALDAAATRRSDTTSVARASPADGSNGAWQWSGTALMEDITHRDRQLKGSLVFPEVSTEGSRWVDGGSISLVFQQFMTGFADREELGLHVSTLSIDVLSLVPRSRALTIEACLERTDSAEQHICAAILDDKQVFARARGRWI
ncbi:hypothetical protein [uncultured Modestobacter sp.]|uniref:hypothetical protein n=1 Tax=uncultured Modestobacter sp. TaxID=380048 RepID=UPI0026160FB2|nr:hypothetical protein [uncultured Modestobacter sp.]